MLLFPDGAISQPSVSRYIACSIACRRVAIYIIITLFLSTAPDMPEKSAPPAKALEIASVTKRL
jgi:hypothetical protein